MRNWKTWAVIAVVIVIMAVTGSVLHIAQSPKVEAQNEAEAIAKKYADIQKSTDFYWYNRQQTYFTVAGTTSKNEAIYAIIAKSSSKVTVYKQSSGITKNEALTKVWDLKKPKKVLNISLGLLKNKPVWEVSFLSKKDLLGYFTIDFKTGDQVKVIDNL